MGGAYLWLRIYARDDYSERFQGFKNIAVGVALVLDLTLGIIIESVAIAVHIGGLIAGFLFMFLYRKHALEKDKYVLP